MKLLVLSDIHGNWPALDAILQAEGSFDGVVFAGDVVDYGPCPVDCLAWLVEHVNFIVRGNHDNALAFGQDCRCMGSFREFSLATRAWHSTLLGEDDLDYLRSLPNVAAFDWAGKKFRMAHATPYGDLFEYLPMEQWEQRIQGLDSHFVILGHTHIQGMRTFGIHTVVNPGSVGLARDHKGEACYAVFDGRRMLLKHIPYDVHRTSDLLRRAPLPKAVVNGLIAAIGGA